ncbi:PHP domain-containing protein [Dethiothermospora halolimnae]|uniref:PHP domain-containing protein n=1 Tax=Dethiothermospora halolimnae TaxID=3114390 RepID=UPI003CCB81E0
MELSIDLHIHSTLSPCGSDDMTPNNIINMSYIKGLDVISITDHNTMLNYGPAYKIAKKKGITLIPGIEVTTKEEVHILCYFDDFKLAYEFGKIIYNSLPNIKNQNDIFGNQYICDESDEVVGSLDKLLLNSTTFSIKEVNKLIKNYKGVMIPAHVDRKSYSILGTLGFIPDYLDITTIEVSNRPRLSKINKFTDLSKYNIIENSDAHYLQDINERINYIYPKENQVKSILEYLSKFWGNNQ